VCSQKPITGPCHEPDESSPHPPILFVQDQFNIILRIGLLNGIFPSGFWTKIMSNHLSSPICATCSDHTILFDLIILAIFGDEYKSRSSSFCRFLQSTVTFTSTRVKIFSSAHSSQARWIDILPLMWETKFQIHTKQVNYSFAGLYFNPYVFSWRQN
jgi:hypothetical protein